MNAPHPFRLASASIPVAMSLVALALVLGHAAVYGLVHEVDEGATAHLFQLLMIGQVPIVAFFLIKWARRVGRAVLPVFGAQVAAAAAAFASVWWLT